MVFLTLDVRARNRFLVASFSSCLSAAGSCLPSKGSGSQCSANRSLKAGWMCQIPKLPNYSFNECCCLILARGEGQLAQGLGLWDML